MSRARRHQRLLSFLAFGLLALAGELVGAAVTHRIDLGRHVSSPSYSHAAYYPALVAAVKIGSALLLARLVWRVVRARATERAACRVVGVVTGAAPRLRATLSPRLWLAFVVVTAAGYLVQADVEHAAGGRWALLFPWIHTSALPVFAVLSVLVALAWGVVQRWLADYERYAADAVQRARLLASTSSAARSFPHVVPAEPPRRLFGLVFESRPPPQTA
ncbi:MAG TPA: hypothetical protein VFA44_13445 [Gaiellaceae bacterium]|nr:hypothetical protein [Gaiellaceae bacterium]